MNSQALIFPGMSLQSVGIGKDLYDTYPEARATFEEADDALNFKLSELMFAGDHAVFQKMENIRPGLLTVGMAGMRVLEKQTGGAIWDNVDCVMGHSFGEWTALCASGSLAFRDTVPLIRDNARLMQVDPVMQQGKMLALIMKGITEEDVQPIVDEAAQGQVCVIANNNGVGHIVLSGHNDAIDRAFKIAKDRKYKVCMLLNSGLPAHSPLIEGSIVDIRERFASIEVRPPRVPMVSTRARVLLDPADIREEVPADLMSKILWPDAVKLACSRGVSEFIELGTVPLLTGMIRHMKYENVSCTALTDPPAIDAFLARLAL